MCIAYLGNLLAEAINPSQDLDPSYFITIPKFSRDKVQGMLVYSLEELQKLNSFLCLHV